MDWSDNEVELTVADYFSMLKEELIDHEYSKSHHRKALLPLLNNRSETSIEFKHRNISAVLIEMGLPFIRGYKPLFNYQQLLIHAIKNYLENNQSIIQFEFEQFANEAGAIKSSNDFDFLHFLSEDPVISKIKNTPPIFKPIKTNYLEKEQNNSKLGEAGEKLIVEYERWRLTQVGKENLANKVEWVSKIYGDGAGFDILSKNADGSDRYIEVKTTKLAKETPIFLTETELSFAALKGDSFYLYRVFDFKKTPKFFFRNGGYEKFAIIKPESYKAYFTPNS